MRIGFALSGLLLAASPAGACLPPPPDWVPPSDEAVTERLVEGSTDIVHGIVTRREGPKRPLFKVLHVYRGTLKPGQTLEIHRHDYAGNFTCLTIPRPPLLKGTEGLAAYDRQSRSLILFGRHAQIAFDKGWLPRGRGAGEAR
jgi:hypothetical protein